MRSKNYGKDHILKLCDVKNKLRLAQHLLCAVIYEMELRVFTGSEEEQDNSCISKLTRHLRALDMNAGYREAYSASRRDEDWDEVARFFSDAVERGGREWEQEY